MFFVLNGGVSDTAVGLRFAIKIPQPLAQPVSGSQTGRGERSTTRRRGEGNNSRGGCKQQVGMEGLDGTFGFGGRATVGRNWESEDSRTLRGRQGEGEMAAGQDETVTG